MSSSTGIACQLLFPFLSFRCSWRKPLLKWVLRGILAPHLDLAAEVPSIAIKSNWGTLMSTFILFYRECWESTHWHIDYNALYTLNPHNETPLHFHACTLSHTHLHRISVQGQFTCVSLKFLSLQHLVYHWALLSSGPAGVCVCVWRAVVGGGLLHLTWIRSGP